MLDKLRTTIREHHFADEQDLLTSLIETADLTPSQRESISARAAELINAVRQGSDASIMESFLAEFGLSTQEGVALMCLAEALLRVPDSETVDDLIRDKIMPHDWGSHVGDSGSILVNASTWALMLTGKVLGNEQPGVVGALKNTVRRLGEPVVRVAVKRAMQEMGEQFVLGENIDKATKRGNPLVKQGYTYSYDMLGEAARTYDDAERYFNAYADAINALAKRAQHTEIDRNPGISIKLSALHPRYEYAQGEIMREALSDKLLALAILARKASIGLNVDAEEANRLDVSLDIIEQVLASPALVGWAGFGVVVQAYGKRAAPVIDWIYELAKTHDRQVMVRLVKGAYWDTEIKLSQVEGQSGYPVFTRKTNTDVSYIACARKLMNMRDRIYPQFATHNAHTIAAVLEMAAGDNDSFEFQRLHGMGEPLHEVVRKTCNARCRIYAPVGAHEDLLAYLVRRLLENGANSSFVNQIVDEDISPEEIAADPVDAVLAQQLYANDLIRLPGALYEPERTNSRGWDIQNCDDIAAIDSQKAPFLAPYQWSYGNDNSKSRIIRNPAIPEDIVGSIDDTAMSAVSSIIERGINAQSSWAHADVAERAEALNRAADLFEDRHGEIFALLAREAGKSLADAIAELREAVDFLRYYAIRGFEAEKTGTARGLIVCISPWNFPLAIFAGQVAAALVTGNAVIAKPAEQTPLIAKLAVNLLHKAGVPADVLQLAMGDGESVGAALCADPRIAGVCFTGSTSVAKIIDRQLALSAAPDAMLIAETGGLNAMIVDSTALNEQAVRDITASAFQSAGQRCSALRILYVQKDREEALLEMLYGAMDALVIGNPQELKVDVGPLIDEEAYSGVMNYIRVQHDAGRVEKSLEVPAEGFFAPPTVVRVQGIESMEREIFGPVLHIASFDAEDIDQVVGAINARGYGLTLGLHTRIDERVQRVVSSAKVGNVYVNRNQIGAIVGSQPFGGEGLSGTGPKAGGPNYLGRFRRSVPSSETAAEKASELSAEDLQAAFIHDASQAWSYRPDRLQRLGGIAGDKAGDLIKDLSFVPYAATELPGPTGESNRLSLLPAGKVLCTNSSLDDLYDHVIQALTAGNTVVAVAPGAREHLSTLCKPDIPLLALDGTVDCTALLTLDIDVVASAALNDTFGEIRRTLSKRDGPIVRLVSSRHDPARFTVERAVCIDTTAAGGNAQLLAASS